MHIFEVRLTSGFPCEQVRQGSRPPLVHQAEWFPNRLHPGCRGVSSRRPGRGLVTELLTPNDNRSPRAAASSRFPCFYNAIYRSPPPSGAAEERRQASFRHESPEEAADSHQRSARTHPEGRTHPNGDSLSIHSEVLALRRYAVKHYSSI